MHKPPVFYVLIQVKFNTIQMARYVEDFLEALRRSGYPDYSEDTQTEMRVVMGPDGPRQFEQYPRKRWQFLNRERTEGFTLLEDALIYHTNRYENFSRCRAETLKALEILHKQVTLDYVDRVGMRYLDAIVPLGGLSLADLVKPALLGPGGDLPGKLEQGFSETRKAVDGGGLVLRTLVNEHALVIPPDLQNQTLSLSPDLRELRGTNMLVDTDYFVERRFAFDLQAVAAQLDSSRAVLVGTFKGIITEKAQQLWL